MLPGQVVNVLNVPMHFSSGNHRSRNASVSSTSSELRTMNPEDKYINPRPAPTPPAPQASALDLDCSTLSRSSTYDRSSHHRNASLPASTISLRSFRLPQKSSMDRRGRSASPTHRPTGLKAALRSFAPPKAISPESNVIRGRTGFPATGRERSSSDHVRPSDSTVARRDARKAAVKTLALRQSVEESENVEETLSNSSFQNHRRQRSRSREPLPLQSSFASREEPKEELLVREGNFQPFQPLETVNEVFSAQNTPIWPSSGAHISKGKSAGTDPGSEDSDKRLPTLPNTPSACPSDECHTTRAGDLSNEPGGLRSNTSKVTMSDDCPSSTVQSQFSRWTGTTASSSSSSQWSSVFFNGKSPSFTQGSDPSSQLTSPYERASTLRSPEAGKEGERSSILDANRMPSTISSSTISSYENNSPSSPASEVSGPGHAPKNEPTSLQKRYGMMLGSFQRYKFLLDDHTSGDSVRCHLPYRIDDQIHHTYSDDVCSASLRKATIDDFQPSTSMQKLMAELSYLGDMIQK